MANRLRLIAVSACLVVLGASIGAIARAEVDDQHLDDRIQMIESVSGADWLSLRDAICNLDPTEREAINLFLQRDEASFQGRVAAACIDARVLDPDRAQLVDAAIQYDLENPIVTVNFQERFGLRTAAILRSNAAFAPFAAELLLLRSDLPASLRLSSMRALSESDSLDDALLGLLEREPEWAGHTSVAMSLSKYYRDTRDSRALHGLASSYHWARENYPDSAEFVRVIAPAIANCESLEAHTALLEILEHERSRFELSGLAPWDDITLLEIGREKIEAERKLERFARLNASAGEGQAVDSETMDAIRSDIELFRARYEAKSVWNVVEGCAARLDALHAD